MFSGNNTRVSGECSSMLQHQAHNYHFLIPFQCRQWAAHKQSGTLLHIHRNLVCPGPLGICPRKDRLAVLLVCNVSQRHHLLLSFGHDTHPSPLPQQQPVCFQDLARPVSGNWDHKQGFFLSGGLPVCCDCFHRLGHVATHDRGGRETHVRSAGCHAHWFFDGSTSLQYINHDAVILNTTSRSAVFKLSCVW